MRPVTLIVPGTLETLTGGYGYDRRIVQGLRARGLTVDVRELDASFPRPTRLALDAAARRLAELPDDSTVLIDGLALGAMPAEVERERARLRLVAIVHHPLAAESGLDAQTAAALETSERRALATVRVVVVTSHATAAALEAYGVAGSRVQVVEPGTEPATPARGSGSAVVQLLSVAAIIPRKGHEALLRALATVSPRNWRLTCVGSLERHPSTVERLRAVLCEEGLEDRVSLAGEMECPALARQYDRADVFVLPTLHEGYGMAVAEALARGLPVVSTATGAIAELVVPKNPAEAGSHDSVRPVRGPDSVQPVRGVRLQPDQAGLLVPPDDVPALAAALSAVIGDPNLRARLAQGARQARERLPSWDQASQKMAEVIARVQR